MAATGWQHRPALIEKPYKRLNNNNTNFKGYIMSGPSCAGINYDSIQVDNKE